METPIVEKKGRKTTGNLQKTIEDFLAQKRIAVAGVSRNPKEAANLIYRKLRDEGHRVFAINPNAVNLENDPCYPNLATVPESVDAVVIVTPPDATTQIIKDCVKLGIHRVWIHKSFMGNSLSDEALEICRQNNITAIPGACPMMYGKKVDWGHRCMRGFMKWTKKLPEPIH